MRKSTSGFTIVELLIVVVVIAILAAISIVAYTGIQQRARNSQTLSAVNSYIKAINMYKADNGQYPPVSSCLGDVDCDSTSEYDVNKGNLNTTYLSKYLGSLRPQPAENLSDFNSTRRLGGAWYAWNNSNYGGANNGGIGLYHQGSEDCPSVGGLTLKTSEAFIDGTGKWCRYSMD